MSGGRVEARLFGRFLIADRTPARSEDYIQTLGERHLLHPLPHLLARSFVMVSLDH